MESLNNEIKRIIVDGGLFTEADYPFTIQPDFSILGSIIEIAKHEPIISFLPDDFIRKFSGFNANTLYEEYNLSPNPVDILSFANKFFECDIPQGMIFRRKRRGLVHIFTMYVDPGYKDIEKIRGGVQWYMMGSESFISSISVILKKEDNQLVTFNGESTTFRILIRET